jgi:hypothetical protein
VIAVRGRDRLRPSRKVSTTPCQDCQGVEQEFATGGRRACIIFGGVFDQLDDSQRFAGVILDLSQMHRDRMPVEIGCAAHCRALERSFQLEGVAIALFPNVDASVVK